MTAAPGPARYFAGLDAVRFAAAVIVMLYHLGWLLFAVPKSLAAHIAQTVDGPRAFSFGPWFGWIGVQIFFVVSGLVIANSADGSGPFAFARSRIVRLYPAAWLCATVSLLVASVSGMLPHLFLRYVSSLMLSPLGHWMSPVYWTLRVEMAFYTLVFLCLLFLPKLPLQRIALALAAWSGLYIVCKFIIGHGLPAVIEQLLLLRHGVFFAIGILFWLRTVRSLTALEWVALAASSGLGIAEIFLTAHGKHIPAAWPILVWLTAVSFTVLTTDMPLAEGKASRALRTIGLMTYPVYLLHYNVGSACVGALLRAGATPLVSLAISVMVIFVLSYAVVAFGEPMIRPLLRRALERLDNRSALRA